MSVGSADDRIRVVHVPSFPPPKGYANGVIARGRRLYVAGQVGWNEREEIVGDDMGAQFVQALDNVLTVVRAAGGTAGDVVKMTVFVTDVDAYIAARGTLRSAWRDRFDRHYPAMALIGVARLMEPGAKVEIEAIAELADE
jgi:enamine deaminase RidA (YjgF/YER057c/UK114 family)